MPEKQGYIELDRTVDSITVGARHRRDVGDLAALMASIETLGLLQPITITPDGVLICGWRRLQAVRRLGRRTINVWVRSGISDRLQQLMAERDENILRRPLSMLEKATLFDELKALRTEDAERRKQATQFGATTAHGGVTVTPPGEHGKARVQAAMAIDGKPGTYTTLERVSTLMDWAERKATPPEIRAMAKEALRRIEQGEPPTPLYRAVRAAYDKTQQPVPAPAPDLNDIGSKAQERAAHAAEELGKANLPRRREGPTRLRSVRSFVLTWTELDGWTEMYDVDELAIALSATEWERFDRVVTATLAFRDQLIAARRDRTSA